MVLFVTGLCKRKCFYCPLSEKKSMKDVIYANERPIEKSEEIVEEARTMRALGTGITGGEPLLVLERTLDFMKLLKKEMGEKHHIHLYTTETVNKPLAEELHSAGLDEIRFHIKGRTKNYLKSVESSKEAGMSAGVELPAIPGCKDRMIEATELNIDFLNLNELEFADLNYSKMLARGMESINGISAVGSSSVAREVKKHSRVPVNFCSSWFKDGVQLRRRLLRTAHNVAKSYERVSRDGTLLIGMIENCDLNAARKLFADFEVREGKIYTDPVVLKRVAQRLPPAAVAYVSEVYPTWDSLEVEREYIKDL